jgi:cytochrome P450
VDLLNPILYADGSIHQLFRSLPPVSWQSKPGYWAVLGYPEARQVLTDSARFSSRYGTGIVSEPKASFVSLNLSDPPQHTALRRHLSHWLAGLQVRYQTDPEPLRGLPRQTLQAILQIGTDTAADLQRQALAIAYAPHKAAWRLAEDRLMACLRGLQTPLALHLEPTDRLYLLRLLVLSGLESTTAALASLCQHRPHLSMIEEMLRLYPPIQRFARRAMTDLRLGPARLQQGDRVIVFFAAANRDPRIFPNPDEWAPGRAPHLSFGAGPHRCPGAHLARRQLEWLAPNPPPCPARFYASSFSRGPIV